MGRSEERHTNNGELNEQRRNWLKQSKEAGFSCKLCWAPPYITMPTFVGTVSIMIPRSGTYCWREPIMKKSFFKPDRQQSFFRNHLTENSDFVNWSHLFNHRNYFQWCLDGNRHWKASVSLTFSFSSSRKKPTHVLRRYKVHDDLRWKEKAPTSGRKQRFHELLR